MKINDARIDEEIMFMKTISHKVVRLTDILALTALVALTIFFASGVSASQKDNRMNSNEDFLSAVTKGEAARVEQMLKSNPQLARSIDKNGVSAVLLAVYHGKREVVNALLASNIELDIFEAAATGSAKRVGELLKKDEKLLNAYSADGFYPLGLAIFFGHKETAMLLLESGADVNQAATNAMRVRPLHAAAASRQLELAQALLERGAEPNAGQQGGFTPLHEAAATGQLELAKLLLGRGANINAKSDAGKTALSYAIENNQTEMAKFLEARGGAR
jgi:ankyrin repeat protein